MHTYGAGYSDHQDQLKTVSSHRIAGKFGGLTVYVTTTKLKSIKISYLHIYIWRSHTAANILAIAILGSTTKLNSREYFRLYGILSCRSFPLYHIIASKSFLLVSKIWFLEEYLRCSSLAINTTHLTSTVDREAVQPMRHLSS